MLWDFVNKSNDTNSTDIRRTYGTLSGGVGIFCNLMLFAIKVFAGIMSGAVSITADAFNNLSDAASSAVTLVGFRLAGKPADLEHPFGHGRIEYLSGIFVSFMIVIMGYELLKNSISKIITPTTIEFSLIPVLVLVVSILVKLWMAYFNFKLSKKISSKTIKASAMDSISDCISTTAVLVGMILFGVFNLNIDAYIGCIVAVLIIVAGVKTIKDTMQPLLGALPDKEIVNEIYELVNQEEKIIGIHDMIIHDYGPGRRMVSLHAEVANNIDMLEAHDVIDNVEKLLEEKLKFEATIHIDPVITDDDELKHTREMVTNIINNINPLWKIHDLRIVRGVSHTNVLFDLVVSSKEMLRAKEIETEIKTKINSVDSNYYAVIKVEQGFV